MRNDWRTANIDDVCHVMTGGTPSRDEPGYFGGDIKWLVSGDIHRGEIFDCEGRITAAGMQNSNAKLLPVNSVLIALNGQGKTRGTVALLRTAATCNQSLVSIYPKNPQTLLPEYIYANLHGRYQEIRRMTGDSGNDRRGLNMGLIKAIEIPIAPFPEQRRIVGILDKAFAAIATAKANTEKTSKTPALHFGASWKAYSPPSGTRIRSSNCLKSRAI
jgi:type I restriction enzyme, S subunit